MLRTKRQALASWLFLAVLGTVAAILGALQYHWLGEVSAAEQERLRSALQGGLARVAEEFDSQVAAFALAVAPAPGAGDAAAREHEWAGNFARAARGREAGIARAFYVARAAEGGLLLRRLDLATGAFADAAWPASLADVREQLARRAEGMRGGPLQSDLVIDVPYFGPAEDGGPRAPVEWGLLELNREFLASRLIPALLERQFGDGTAQGYDFRVARAADERLVYASSDSARAPFRRADAAVELFATGPMRGFGARMGGRPGLPRPDGEPRHTPDEVRGGRGPGHFRPVPHGRWILQARSRAGSLETLVEKARRRNLFVISGLLALTVAAGVALATYARRAHQLAAMQMDFVAGVSHELRTPISVVRTAGYNLARTPASDSERVRQYGELIEAEAEKLSGIVEEVLGFAKARAGRAIGPVARIEVGRVVDQAIAASRAEVDRDIEDGLPPVLADEAALRQAIQNVVLNAVKHGAGWVGVTARANHAKVEIAVSDHGPGIPADELPRIFEPFYRGRRALSEQIHGTGLGLALVKRIVEAHHGTISVRSAEGRGTEFVICLPAAPETAHPAG